MKPCLIYLSVLFVATLFIQWDSPNQQSSIKQGFGFEADSGYILKKEGLKILKAIYEKDSTYSDWNEELRNSFNDYTETDTLGKYYKNASGNILACLIFPVPAHLIVEITPDGDIVKNENFSSGMYLCCMNNLDEAFRKKGNYFIVKTCATGSSAFCASYIYPFKDLIPQEEMSGIDEYVSTNWCGDENTSCELIGLIDVRENTIIMHYTATKEKFKKNGDLKNKKTEKFDVTYTQKGLEWIPSDTAKLEEFKY